MSTPRSPNLALPYPTHTDQGSPRRLGIEIELAGLDLDQLSELMVETVGGVPLKTSEYEVTISGSSLGNIRIEFDAALFRELKVKNFVAELDSSLWNGLDKDGVEKAFAKVAQWVVPFEIVFDPLPFARLPEIDAVRLALSRRALGTSSFMLYAFGLHFNPELPSLDVATILAYLRSFLVLYERLKHSHGVNTARSLSGFIGPFPREYVLLVLDARYRPSLEQFIDDYLTLNPTRNRPLDLLPLLTYLDEAKVRARLPLEKIGKRPAFHYRLPDSRVDEPDWSIAREWELWLRVERLANDPKALAKRTRYELKRLRGPMMYWLRRLWRTKPLLSSRPMIAVTGPDQGGSMAWMCTWLALKRAGAQPVRLTPCMFEDDPTLPPFDGLVLGGGADIDSARYQLESDLLWEQEESADDSDEYAVASPKRRLSRLVASLLFFLRHSLALTSVPVDKERDEFEQACLDKALSEGLPVLGICRGAQFLNVALGGDLHEEIASFYGEVGRVSTVLPSNRVELVAGSVMERILGRRALRVNSLNHQAIRTLGEGLRVCAYDSAGVIQAVESSREPVTVGVQWHPEYLPASRTQQRLFKALVQDASFRKR